MRPAVAGIALLAALSAGCGSGEGKRPTGPRLEAIWTGADTAALGAPATAKWCDSLRMLEIVAIAGDTGIGIAVYPSDSIASGRYRVRPPATADSLPPAAAVGLRWFSETAVQGFQGDSGEVTLTRTPGGVLSGRFTAAARAIVGNGRLTLTGSFDDLRAIPATRGCSTAPIPPPDGGADPEERVD